MKSYTDRERVPKNPKSFQKALFFCADLHQLTNVNFLLIAGQFTARPVFATLPCSTITSGNTQIESQHLNLFDMKTQTKLQSSAAAIITLVTVFSPADDLNAQSKAGILGIDHVGINVPSLESALPFFTDVLGFSPVTQLGPIPLDENWKKQNHIDPKTGAVTIKMINAGSGASIEVFAYENNQGNKKHPNSDDIGASHIAFYVKDMNQAVAYLKSKNVKFIGEPFLMPSGDTAGETWVYFETPWGSKMELVSYPNGKAYEKSQPKTLLWSPKNAASDSAKTPNPSDFDTAANQKLVTQHLEIWNEKNVEKRDALMKATYAQNIEMVVRHFIANGNAEIAKFVAGLQNDNKGFAFTVKSVETHHNIARLYWQFGPKSKPDTVTGMDLFVIENGKITKLYVFVDEAK